MNLSPLFAIGDLKKVSKIFPNINIKIEIALNPLIIDNPLELNKLLSYNKISLLKISSTFSPKLKQLLIFLKNNEESLKKYSLKNEKQANKIKI